MNRLIIILLGVGLTIYGYTRFSLGARSSDEPDEWDLEMIEEGQEIENLHVLIGPHIRLYALGVYSVTEKTNKVQDVYFPIVSMARVNPEELVARLQTMGEKERVEVDFSILVKSEDFHNRAPSTVPFGIEKKDSIQGLIVESFDELPRDARVLLRRSFEGVDFKEVMILEEGRGSPSAILALVLMIVGGLVVLGGIGTLFMRRE